MVNILYLTLFRKWFDEVLQGKKKIEFREIKPYWTKRLDGRQYDYVIFKNGYSKEAPMMKVECLGIRKKERYEILLGRILETANLKL